MQLIASTTVLVKFTRKLSKFQSQPSDDDGAISDEITDRGAIQQEKKCSKSSSMSTSIEQIPASQIGIQCAQQCKEDQRVSDMVSNTRSITSHRILHDLSQKNPNFWFLIILHRLDASQTSKQTRITPVSSLALSVSRKKTRFCL